MPKGVQSSGKDNETKFSLHTMNISRCITYVHLANAFAASEDPPLCEIFARSLHTQEISFWHMLGNR